MREQSSELRFEILGSLRAWRGDIEIGLGPAQQRTLLAALLARAGRAASIAELTDLLWPERAPKSAVNLIYNYVGDLRRHFEPDLSRNQESRWLVRDSGGYRMRVGPDTLDLLRFRAYAAEARDAAKRPDDPDALGYFVRALALWNGRCADLFRGGGATTASYFTAIDSEYLALLREAADVALGSGGAARIVPVLREAAARDLLDEGLQARLMLLLASLGRQAEALRLFLDVRSHLAEEVGVDPSEELRNAYQQVLAQLPVPDGTPPPGSHGRPGGNGAPPPAQLPHDPVTFVGREEELAAMWAVAGADRTAGGMVVLAVDGLPGVGKSALAVHWAHAASECFPDGQFYLDLRGFDAQDAPVAATEALRAFLVASGIAPECVPAGVEEQSALFRSLLADKRVLIVLDNVRDAEQVRPLLPGAAGCGVVVTSRTYLADLVVRDGAVPLGLAALPAEDARMLLARRLGSARVAGEPDAVAEIVNRCAGLPLALAIVAADAAASPAFPLAEIARRLAGADSGLQPFDAGGLTAVFSWSYRLLDGPAAELFRYLALAPGPDASLPTLACLLGLPWQEVRGAVDELLRNRLLTEHSPDRFTVHPLVRRYACDLNARLDAEADRARAVRRLAGWYLRGLAAVHRTVRPRAARFESRVEEGDEDEPFGPAVVLTDRAAALSWYETEWRSAASVRALTRTWGLHRTAARLARALAVCREARDGIAGGLPGRRVMVDGTGPFSCRGARAAMS
ncbi:BTAD domain-containing putative transcriptional regulator [Streptomyces sp. NPDC051642]|uniref:AfsR/SARP family transcriptional regulator n=1 Tax=Streptomyces sp. NPDC051642 TaxID=3154646 RepID=UPI0034381EDC